MLCCTVLIGLTCTTGTLAQEIQVERYSTVQALPTQAQVDPLLTVVTVRFPEQVTTVGEAIHDLLRHSGYRLASLQASDPAMETLVRLALPEVHRALGPMRLDRALTTLSGQAFRLVRDPVHRLVSFELCPLYRELYANPQPAAERTVLLHSD